MSLSPRSCLRLLAFAATLGLGASLTTPALAAKAPAVKKTKTVKVKHQQNNSQESSAERDRRLYRECRGRPNAGACLGYTQR